MNRTILILLSANLLGVTMCAQEPQSRIQSPVTQEVAFDTFPPRVPISTNPYDYPEHLPHSREDGYITRGGRFGETDLINHVFLYKNNPDSNNNNPVLERIDFFELENRYLGSFDVRANNPYPPEKFQPFLSESYTDCESSVVDRRQYPDYDWRQEVYQYASMVMVGGYTPCGTQTVAYYLQAISEDLTLLGVLATFVLLDSTGKEVARFEDIEDVFFGQGILTCDHKYFCLRYGGEYATNGGRMYNDRFRIYDVESKKIIYELELPEKYHLTGPAEQIGGWVMIHQNMDYYEQVKKGYNTSQIKLAFDLKNRLK